MNYPICLARNYNRRQEERKRSEIGREYATRRMLNRRWLPFQLVFSLGRSRDPDEFYLWNSCKCSNLFTKPLTDSSNGIKENLLCGDY